MPYTYIPPYINVYHTYDVYIYTHIYLYICIYHSMSTYIHIYIYTYIYIHIYRSHGTFPAEDTGLFRDCPWKILILQATPGVLRRNADAAGTLRHWYFIGFYNTFRLVAGHRRRNADAAVPLRHTNRTGMLMSGASPGSHALHPFGLTCAHTQNAFVCRVFRHLGAANHGNAQSCSSVIVMRILV